MLTWVGGPLTSLCLQSPGEEVSAEAAEKVAQDAWQLWGCLGKLTGLVAEWTKDV